MKKYLISQAQVEKIFAHINRARRKIKDGTPLELVPGVDHHQPYSLWPYIEAADLEISNANDELKKIVADPLPEQGMIGI